MTSQTPDEVHEEILERAARLVAVNGHRFDEQHECMLKGLPYDVIIVRFLKDDALMVFYDVPQTLCVAANTPRAVPDNAYVCAETAQKVLDLMRKNMILEDLIDG
jgi:hypothetical protein